jgi:hypothetical protein
MKGRAISFRGASVGDDKDQALRYAEQLEENIEAAFRRVEDGFLRKLDPQDTTERSVTAKIGQLIVAKGTLTVTLPVATRDNAGRPVAVATLAGVVTVQAQTGQSLNGSATAAVAAADGMKLFWSLGDKWGYEA